MSSHDQLPKRKTIQNPDVEDPFAAGMFIAKGQGQGLEVVHPKDLARARAAVAEDAPAKPVRSEPALTETQDMVTFGKQFPEIKGFDIASGIIHFQDGPSMKMNHLPGLPKCDLKVEFQDARHTELRISYGEKYSLLLSRRAADGKIDMIADIGKGGRKMTDAKGNYQDLRSAIEEFKIRAYENFLDPDTHVNYMDVVEASPITELAQPVPEQKPVSKKSPPGPIGQLRKWLGI